MVIPITGHFFRKIDTPCTGPRKDLQKGVKPAMKVISGGQTGVDRGALDAAIAHGFPHGGTCPRGRRAEDGSIPATYQLEEHSSPKYPPRTAKNICDADATLVLVSEPRITGGSKLTVKIARDRGKPWLAVHMKDEHVERTARWISSMRPEVLNVAGPRESKFPGIQNQARDFLRKVFARVS